MVTEARLVRYVKQAWYDEARKQRDIPKRQRQRRTIDPTRPLVDTQVLGHPPRGRRKRARRG